MSAARKELQEALCRYITDTLSYMDTVRGFCKGHNTWMIAREKELKTIKDIIHSKNSINLNLVIKSQKKLNAFSKYMKNKVARVNSAKLEKELVEVLEETLQGLEKLHCFLDAVEKLAVTSLHVFMENQVIHLPREISLEHVQVVITAARLLCPLLLEFKRDAKAFFCPRLQNVEVLSYQLDKYIRTTQRICDGFTTSSSREFSLNMTVKTVIDLDVGLSEEDTQRMLDHVNQLDEIRMNQAFRMVFLFQDEPCSGFIKEFSERQPRMLQFLTELEETAVQLDRMNKGAKISSVVGSSVGAVGGVLSILGLALTPVTAGASLALTMTGLGLGLTSGVNGLVTTATECGVNYKQQKKASEVFQSFMEDVQTLQDCLEETMKRDQKKGRKNNIVATGTILVKMGGVGKKIYEFVDAGKVVAQEGKALRTVPRLASDVPDIGQAAVKGPLALTKSARAGLFVVNSLFLGMDVFFICKDSISLAKGTETEMSRFIRARVAMWSSEMDSWQKMHDLLNEGLLKSEKNRALLETPFYPEREKKQKERKKRGYTVKKVLGSISGWTWCLFMWSLHVLLVVMRVLWLPPTVQ